MDMLYWLFVSERLFYIFQLANLFSINLESPYLKCVWHALEKILFVFINLRHITQSVFVVVGAEKEAAGTGHIAKWCPVKQKIPSVNTRGGGTNSTAARNIDDENQQWISKALQSTLRLNDLENIFGFAGADNLGCVTKQWFQFGDGRLVLVKHLKTLCC